MGSPTRTVILDCDTGADDALAILMAVGLSPLVRLVGVTTVHGNASPSVTCDNSRRILAAAGASDVPVILGAACELRRMDAGELSKREDAWADDQGFDFLPGVGSDDAVIPGEASQAENAAAEWLVQATKKYPGVALVLTAPLTNIAMALRRDPSLARRVGSVSIMGGCFDVDWAYSEFNFESDALAAAEVLSANWAVPPVIVGLNLTCQAWLPSGFGSSLGRSSGPVAKTAAAVLRWNDPSGEGCEMFDPCALAVWINPTLVECADADVWIDESTGFTGLSLEAVKTSRKSRVRRVGKLQVARTIKSAEFFDLMRESLHGLYEPAHVVNEPAQKKRRRRELGSM